MDARAIKILQKLIISNSYIESTQIQEDFGISKRTFQYDIEKIDSELKAAEFSGIIKIRSKGFFLLGREKKKINEWLNSFVENTKVFTAMERKIRIFIYLTATPIRVVTEDLIEWNEVSRNTVLQDIKQLKEALKEFDLEIGFNTKEGKIVLGNEKNIRLFFVFYCLNNEEIIENGDILKLIKNRVSINKDSLFSDISFVKGALFNIEKELQLKYTDEIFERLILIVSFFVERIKQGKYVSNEMCEVVDVVEAADRLYQQFMKSDSFIYDKAEINFLAKILLGANQIISSSKTEDKFVKCSKQIISDFERLACITFDQQEQLQNDLLLHLKPAYYRIKYQIEVINPSYQEIKKDYNDVFEITANALQSFRKLLDLKIPDSEIAYFSILFGGYLTQKKVS